MTSTGAADPESGIIIDDTGRALLQHGQFNTSLGIDFYDETRTPIKPEIGFVRTGSAVSGEWFSFGVGSGKDTVGYLSAFQAGAGQPGGDIAGVHARNPATLFNISGLVAGDGGVGGRGGNILDVTLNGDNAGGYVIKAGNGGRGPSGGLGGSITNFQDLFSETAQIVIKSGNGGAATTGAGGNAGEITFGTMNVNGGLGINLGNGGDGFTAGGNGASLAKAIITTPEGGVPTGSSNVGTTHQGAVDPVTHKLLPSAQGVIGRHFGIDFDHDGFGDSVITSTNPNTVSVLFGAGLGGFRFDPSILDPTFNPASLPLPGRFSRIELDAPINPEAITVADFNQDGFMDIAVASSAPGNFGGIAVFLSLTEDTNDDGKLTAAEDLDHDGIVDFLGFRSARYSFLPSLAAGDPDAFASGGTLLNPYLFVRSAVPITRLESGDFDGDGYTDLAVLSTYIFAEPALRDVQVLTFLKSNVEQSLNGDGQLVMRPTGQFYADVGTKASGEPLAAADPFVPFRTLGVGTKGVIQATALSTGDTHDIVAATVVGSRVIRAFDNAAPRLLGPKIVTSATGGVWGRIDTDRQLGANHVNLTALPPTVRDFVISDTGGEQFLDYNKNGVRDVLRHKRGVQRPEQQWPVRRW